jgi:Astacin (Peptidase family M12A)
MATQSRTKTSAPSRKAKKPAAKEGSYMGSKLTPHYCAVKTLPEPKLPEGLSTQRAELLLVTANKWMNGSTLTYAFFKAPQAWVGAKAQQDAVRKAFAEWKALGIGLSFAEVSDVANAQIRIAFNPTDGSWSYVGTYNLQVNKAEPTMNFGWDLTDDYGHTTALHEIGHAIGFPHEHQNPFAGIVWDEEAVYTSLGGPPNFWPREVTFNNILKKLTPDTVQGSKWDPNSVMHYQFGAGLIVKPAKYKTGLRPAGGLSARDKRWVKTFYPPLRSGTFARLLPLKSQVLQLKSGEQANYEFVAPDSREFTFRTFGDADAVVALSRKPEAKGKVPAELARDDDSGYERNAELRLILKKGERVNVKVRVRYTVRPGETALMAF